MSRHRVIWVAVALSVLLHGAAGLALRAAGDSPAAAVEDETMTLTELSMAPEAPEAHEPQAAEPMPDVEPEPEPPHTEPASAGTVEPEPPSEPKNNSADAGIVTDARGVADAGVADAGAWDAGIADGGAPMLAVNTDAGVESDAGAQMLALNDAGHGPDDAGARLAKAGDAAVQRDGGGTAVAAASMGDAGAASSQAGTPAHSRFGDQAGNPNAPNAPIGAGANLLAYFPAGERVTALIRFDRFRGTQWATRLDKMLRPMPDYRALVGTRKMTLADLFESLVISSPRPEDVVATTVVVRYRRSPANMRAFLNHKSARVRWRPSRLGAMGIRRPSRALVPGDPRVFLLPMPELAMLARPSLLGGVPAAATGPLDAFPADQSLPAWMRRVRLIEQDSGKDVGPALVVTLEGLTSYVDIPTVGALAGPDRITLALTLDPHGFILRGNMLFADAARAARFVTRARAMRKELIGSYRGKFALRIVRAYNAVKGLTFKQSGAKVAYATSIAVGDARQMLDSATVLVESYFAGGGSRPPPSAPPTSPAVPDSAP